MQREKHSVDPQLVTKLPVFLVLGDFGKLHRFVVEFQLSPVKYYVEDQDQVQDEVEGYGKFELDPGWKYQS